MKKAFTLVELLGVIVVLGIIGLIVVPAVRGTIESSSKEVCKDQIKSFERAAKNYVSSNPYQFECGASYNVELKELKEKGYLDNYGDFNGKVKITVTCETQNNVESNYKFEYEYAYADTDKQCE